MNLTIDIQAEQLMARLHGTQDRLTESLRSAVLRLAITVQNSVKVDKLTGQVLHVRSGELRRSINQQLTQDAKGITASVGTNVVYARVHEYGYTGTVDVRAHARKLREASTVVLQKPANGRAFGIYQKRRGELTGGVANVRAHALKMNLPARSFLRSALKDHETTITDTLRATALKAVTP